MSKWMLASIATLSLVVFALLFSTQAEGIVLTGHFTDDNGHTFENDIDAIAEVGITKGCNPPANTLFCPNDHVDRGQMAAFLRRALKLPASNQDFFTDDNGSTFEGDINAIAAAGVTRGCNPPANTRYCPTDNVTREQMAAFLVRALELTADTHGGFVDVSSSNTFFNDIGKLATAGITKGCNPPENTRFCPKDDVTRGQMAAFLRRGLDLPSIVQRIPVGHHAAMNCSKDGERCSLTVDLSAGRPYRIQEGLFQVNPASSSEQNQFNASATSFSLTVDGSTASVNEISQQTGGGVTSRYWRRDLNFSSGTHTLVGRWQWDGALIQTNTITIRASR